MSISPSAIAEATYRANAAARRRRTINGWPAPTSPYRKATDAELLKVAARDAFNRDREAAAEPWRTLVRNMLLDEVERLFPAADMQVLARYKAARPISIIDVANHLALESIEAGPGVYVPVTEIHTGGRLIFAADDRSPGRAVPDATLPYFESLRTMRERRWPDYERAPAWASEHIRRERHAPSWGEIEAEFPRVGAWISEKRGN